MMTGVSVPKPKLLFEDSDGWFSGSPPNFIETPLKALNEIIVGLPESELIIIAAKASQGKTSLAMQIAADAAHNGLPVGIFSLEMSRKSLALRLACSVLGIDSSRLHRRAKVPLSAKELKDFSEITSSLSTLPLYVDDRGGLTAEKIYAASIDWKEKYGVKAIFLDYIQLVEGNTDNRQEAIGSAARIFKQIAKELAIPFVALSQVNRAADSRESRIPILSDLRDSGQLEQISDMVLMMSYPNSPDDDLDHVREVIIHVKKNRNSSTGLAHAMFNKRMTRFEDLDAEVVTASQEKRDGKQPSAQNTKAKWKPATKEEGPS